MTNIDRYEAILGHTVSRKCWDEDEWFIPHGLLPDESGMVGVNQDGIEMTISFQALMWNFYHIAVRGLV